MYINNWPLMMIFVNSTINHKCMAKYIILTDQICLIQLYFHAKEHNTNLITLSVFIYVACDKPSAHKPTDLSTY